MEINTLDILFRLLLAHIIGDFFLQNRKILIGKTLKTKGISILYHIFHSFIHAALAYLLVAIWTEWRVAFLIFISHICIDLIKSKQKRDSVKAFILDQAVHIFVILGLWIFYFEGIERDNFPFISEFLQSPVLWAVIGAYLLIMQPTSIFINIFFKQWELSKISEGGLRNAGKWIGYIERFLILTFIFTGNFANIGFLLAAKSIFRFGDLSKEKDLKITEYVLIGTLISFTVGITLGLIVKGLF